MQVLAQEPAVHRKQCVPEPKASIPHRGVDLRLAASRRCRTSPTETLQRSLPSMRHELIVSPSLADSGLVWSMREMAGYPSCRHCLRGQRQRRVIVFENCPGDLSGRLRGCGLNEAAESLEPRVTTGAVQESDISAGPDLNMAAPSGAGIASRPEIYCSIGNIRG